MRVGIVALGSLLAVPASGQGITRIDTVPAPSLAANLLGDPAWRQISVYLPPSYSKEPRRRYPVVYWLHGFTSGDRELISGIRQNLNIRLAMDSLVRAGVAREMIIVMPNAHNAFGGSFFANSPATVWGTGSSGRCCHSSPAHSAGLAEWQHRHREVPLIQAAARSRR